MTNPFLRNLNNHIDNRFSRDLVSMSMTDWISENTSIRGKKFSVDGYSFQRAIMDDMHPNMDVMKISQVGLTECQIRKALAFLTRYNGTNGIFTLQDTINFNKMTTTRIQPIVKREKVFNPEDVEKPVRSKDIMQIRDSFLYVTGCTEGDATSTSADFVFNDELDLSPQDIIALFNSRLQNSTWKINQRFGTPTHAGYGVHGGFLESDQHVIMLQCSRCNHWQLPEFSHDFVRIPGLPDTIEDLTQITQELIDIIDIEGSYVVCEKCKDAIDYDHAQTQWVPTFPGRTHARGYHITPLSTGRLLPPYIIDQLLKYRRRENIRGWYNTVLGLPYSDSQARLTLEDIGACFTAHMHPLPADQMAPHAIGIDMGQICHIVVGRGTDIDNIQTAQFTTCHIDQLNEVVAGLFSTYRIVAGAVDRVPYEPNAQALMYQTDGIIVPAQYIGTKDVQLVKDGMDELSHVSIDRTKALDRVANRVRAHRIQFNGYGGYKQTITTHLREMIRDEQPEKQAVWVKLPSGNDHFFHALALMYAALRIKEVEEFRDDADNRLSISTLITPIGYAGETNLVGVSRRYSSPLLAAH